MRIRYSIRDLLLGTAIVALCVGWWSDHSRMVDKMARINAAVIEGRIVYADSGKPAVGVHVMAQAKPIFDVGSRTDYGEARTDEMGQYRFVNLAPGNYNIFAEADGWTMNAIDSLPLVGGQTVKGADLRLAKGGFIKGRVVDEDTGKPVVFELRDKPIAFAGDQRSPGDQRIAVAVYGPARPQSGAAVERVLVDSNGEFKIRVPAGTNYPYMMNVDPKSIIKGQDYRDEGVHVEDGKTTEIEFSVQTSSARSPPADTPSPARQPATKSQ